MSRIADILEKARKEAARTGGASSGDGQEELRLQTLEEVDVPWNFQPNHETGPQAAREPEREEGPTRVEDRVALSADDAAIARKLFLEGPRHRRILVSAVDSSHGSDVLALGLALALGRETQRSVCLIDLNLAGGTLHRLLHTDGSPGLSQAVLEGAQPRECTRQVHSVATLNFMALGSSPEQLRLALREPAGMTVLRSALAAFDLVVAHAAPGNMDEAVTLGVCFDGDLLVREADTQPQITNAAADALRRASVPLAGVVVNHAARPGSRNTRG